MWCTGRLRSFSVGVGLKRRRTSPKRASGLSELVPLTRNARAVNIDSAYAAGISEACSVDSLRYCPDRDTSRGQAAGYLVRARIL